PKGLLAASLANMGERFGFYTMMAILSLFLMSKFGLDKGNAGIIYTVFYFSIYILALAGGIIADKTKNFKGTILIGIVLMAVGYLILAIPTPTPVPNKALFIFLTCVGLFVIAFGNGLFKGNLQALVGQMYDNEKYSKYRDSGFSIFYMFINIGAIFAPILAVLARNWWLVKNGFQYDPDLPALCHQFLDGNLTTEAAARFNELAPQAIIGGGGFDPTTFANSYLEVFNRGYQYAFGIAVVAMLISLVIYIVNKKRFPDPTSKKVVATSTDAKPVVEMDIKEVKQRIYALLAVFAVVIFFWFSFHQNGLTLTYFAQQYTDLSKFSLNVFNLATIEGAELFQSFNPTFVVLLTPIVLAVFGWLRAKGKEPTPPKKIAIGMGIAAVGYVIMTIGSQGLPPSATVEEMGGLSQEARVTPMILIGTYLVLTIAELFISPLGLSFVSKVAPPQYQGIMQGCWLGATAIGNQFCLVGAFLYENSTLTITWSVFIIACCLSMFMMLFMMRWLERVTK
ncbi:MAG: peptide MFS transporter, partial [Odoribacter sp.]|nr:peptide MFS transporter [Odoribacter sp.]